MAKYPRLGSVRPKKGIQQKCEACPEKGSSFVWVEFTYMRGEDERYTACERHAQMARSNLRDFLNDAEKEFQRTKQIDAQKVITKGPK